MIGKFAAHDERETAVANAAYRLAYIVVSFGVLLSVAYRGLVLAQPSWDLLAWVVLGSVAATAYEARAQILTRRWAGVALAAAVAAAVMAILLVAMR